MCGIGSIFSISRNEVTPNLQMRKDVLDILYTKNQVRGKDTFGIFGSDEKEDSFQDFHQGCNDSKNTFSNTWLNIKNNLNSDATKIVYPEHKDFWRIFNFRGIPTTETEGLVTKGEALNPSELAGNYVQPFVMTKEGGGKWAIVAHNGTIWNDKEVYPEQERANPLLDHDIDSYAILRAYFGANRKFDSDFWKFKGSYAFLLAYGQEMFEGILIARNYLGLYVIIVEDQLSGERLLIFSSESLKKHINNSKYNVYEEEIPPYNYLDLRKSFLENLKQYVHCSEILSKLISSFMPTPDSGNRYTEKAKGSIAVVISGGLDSTVTATWATYHYKDVYLLHFLYGSKAQLSEQSAVQSIYEYLYQSKIQNTRVHLNFIRLPTIEGSTLTDPNGIVTKGEHSAETPAEWVPARNLVMIAHAAAFCDQKEIGTIALGLNREESGAFCLPDKGDNLIRLWNGKNKIPSKIEIGDELLGWNENKKKIQKTIVTKKFKIESNNIYKIAVNSGRKWGSYNVKEYYANVSNQYMTKSKKIRQPAQKRSSRVEKNKVFYATGDHYFFVKDKGWIKLKNIEKNDVIMHYCDCATSERYTYNNYTTQIDMSGKNNPMYDHIRSTKKCWCGRIHLPPSSEKASIGTRRTLESDPLIRKRISKGVRKHQASMTKEDWEVFSRAVSKGILKGISQRKAKGLSGHWTQTSKGRKHLSKMMKLAIKEGRINPATTKESPNNLEKAFISFFKKNRLPYRFVGDGQIWMYHKTTKSRMNPDFINLEKRQIIEVTSKDGYFHNKKERKERLQKYKDLGWQAIYLNESHLTQDNGVSLIRSSFNTLGNGMIVKSIKKIKIDLIPIYDFTCEPHHNYFVGKSGLLSHNSDNCTEFYQSLSKPLMFGTRFTKEVICPLGNLMKRHIVQFGKALGAPLELTWSCYEGLPEYITRCGNCGPCLNTHRAFTQAGYPDPFTYREGSICGKLT